jgi:hypothetical protein
MAGPAASRSIVKIVAMLPATSSPWTTSAEASARRPAPIDRAMADAIAPPMLEFAMSCMSIRSGNTRDNPASALGPSWPTKCASTLAVTAMRMTFTTTFGAARRRSVETIGPSRSSRVPRRSETGTVRTPDPYPSTSLFPSQFGHRVSLMFLNATFVSRSGQAVITTNRGGWLFTDAG